MHGMDVVIFLVFVMYKQLVYPHLVRWWMYVWVIGDRKVIGDVWIESCYYFKKYFCRLCLCSGGAWTQSWELNQYTSTYQRIQCVLRGKHDQHNVCQRGSMILCPWCQRGRVTWCCCCHQVQRGRLLANDSSIVLDGNSLRWKIIVQQVNNKELHISLHIMKKNRYTQVHLDQATYTRRFTDHK